MTGANGQTGGQESRRLTTPKPRQASHAAPALTFRAILAIARFMAGGMTAASACCLSNLANYAAQIQTLTDGSCKMSNELVVSQNAIMPIMSIVDAVNRYNAVIEFTKKVMKNGKDYGVIPGTGDKPTLLKPGAEKLCSLFGFAPDPILEDKIVDFNNGLFYFQYRCRLYRNGELVATGLGSANSKETKYRYRWQNATEKPDKATADKLKAEGLGRWRKFGNDWIWQERIENTEPFDLINTLDKMAQKRALIAATLIAANASEFFTQDIEDMGYIEGDFVEVTEEEPETTTEITTEEKPKANGRKTTTKKADGEADIYQALVDAKISDSVFAAKSLLQNHCKTGYDTIEKAVSWGKRYREAKESGDLTTVEAADIANGVTK